MEEFDEETLRAEIHKVWGAYGAHAELIDILIKKAHGVDRIREVMDQRRASVDHAVLGRTLTEIHRITCGDI